MSKNLYQLLGLNKGASEEEVKRAYRLYAGKLHPDKHNNDPFFEERFKEINEAYNILVDVAKKEKYDKTLKPFVAEEAKSRKSAEKKSEERNDNQEEKRKKVYYTSNDLTVNGLYLNFKGKSLTLADFDSVTVRKNEQSSFLIFGIISILLGLVTLTIFVGFIFLLLGLLSIFYKESFVVMVGRNGDIPLCKGSRYEMKKISKIITRAIIENNKL